MLVMFPFVRPLFYVSKVNTDIFGFGINISYLLFMLKAFSITWLMVYNLSQLPVSTGYLGCLAMRQKVQKEPRHVSGIQHKFFFESRKTSLWNILQEIMHNSRPPSRICSHLPFESK